MKHNSATGRTTRWKDLPRQDKAHVSAATLSASGRDAYTLNVDLGPTRIEKTRHDKRGFVDHVYRTMRRHLKRELGRDPSFWIVVEDRNKTGRTKVAPHVHGVISTDSGEQSALKLALMEVALDYSRARAVSLTPLWDSGGWADYCFKNLHKGDPACTGFKMASSLRRAASRMYDRSRWSEIREKARQVEQAVAASLGVESVPHVPGAAPSGSEKPSPNRAATRTCLGDHATSPHLQERVRWANISIVARLFGSRESSLRQRADEIGSQIDALGADADPCTVTVRRQLEHDRRDALARANQLLEERLALLSERRPPEHADFASLYTPA